MNIQHRVRAANASALALLLIGSLQMAGFVTGSKALRGIGAATGAAPLPKVFSAVNGYETFATQFTLVYEDRGATVRTLITPELYSNLRGPYNRRNVYGGALAYGPCLPDALWRPVLRYGLSADGPLHRELHVPTSARHVRVEIASLTHGREQTRTLDPEARDER